MAPPAPPPLGLDLGQVRYEIVRPVLKSLSLWTPAAENLVLGTGITESRLKYIKQIGKGPALGLWQMEPATHNDLWTSYLYYNEALAALVRQYAPRAYPGTYPPAEHLKDSLKYAAAMCRIHYRRIKAAMPENNAVSLAVYWKKYYNTPLGAGTVEKATPHFAMAVDSFDV